MSHEQGLDGGASERESGVDANTGTNQRGSGETASLSPESAASDIGARAAEVKRARPGASDYSAQFESLVDFAQERGFYETRLIREPKFGSGNEHEVWYDEDSSRIIKATYPNKFGFTIGAGRDATPVQYLDRLALQNEVFGDEICVEGVANELGRIRIVTSQPYIEGRPATAQEMEEEFDRLGFRPLTVDGNEIWYRLPDGVMAFDAHPRNFLTDDSGTVHPIDVNMVHVDPDLKARLDRQLPPDEG